MKNFNLNLVLLSLTTPLAASQCLVSNPDVVEFEMKGECSYEKVLAKLRRLRNVERNQGATNCYRDIVQELGALLGLSNEDDMRDKIDSICDEAISHSRSDPDYAIKFESIPLTDSTPDQETVTRFLKEFYDGGTFFNEQVQQRAGGDPFNLARDARGIKQFYQGPASKKLVTWPTSGVDNFESCELNAAMCCWVQDRQADDDNGNCETPYPNANPDSSDVWTPDNCIDKDPADNTDVCYVDLSRSTSSNRVKSGGIIFDDKAGVREGDAHCHGFAWSNDEFDISRKYRGNNLFYVSMYDHLRQRGYVREVPGAPMCGCLEKMPTVSRSDCTEMDVSENFTLRYLPGRNTFEGKITSANVEFNACQGLNDNNNDLLAYHQRLVSEGKISDSTEAGVDEILVGDDNCGPSVREFLDKFDIKRA